MTPGPAMQIERVHLMTDASLSSAEAQRVSEAFASELDSALRDGRRGGERVSIGELALQVPVATMGDGRAMARLAQSVARRILERGQD